jgi:hypothetical protein
MVAFDVASDFSEPPQLTTSPSGSKFAAETPFWTRLLSVSSSWSSQQYFFAHGLTRRNWLQ